MKQIKLFPHSFQRIGWILLAPFLALGIANMFFEYNASWLQFKLVKSNGLEFFSSHNFTDELAAVGLIISLIFIAFSKEKIEDEAIQFFRLEALQWAVYANYLVLIISILVVYGSTFFQVMTYNMFTVLIIFILRFRYILFQYNKAGI
ncbi:hypothetical protein [Sediminibacterium sp.]|jgi:hypothetical protein|uniref:hypothetical protein n=1 Tax=Sediminibacterium sp. TaxID=1917865 RepID=UPI0025CD73AE|nr:hypothetical protein [Sediminibacterium sp.]MBW0177216.1 hypothetical protein [Sediminibacterium sp.]